MQEYLNFPRKLFCHQQLKVCNLIKRNFSNKFLLFYNIFPNLLLFIHVCLIYTNLQLKMVKRFSFHLINLTALIIIVKTKSIKNNLKNSIIFNNNYK